MTITNIAIKYRTSVVVLTVLLTIGGLLSYLTIPKEAAPSIEIPNIVVTTIYPGASPDDIESIITQKIEQEIQSVNGIVEIRSTSTEGVSTVVVEFDPDVSMDDAFQKVRDKVDIAKAELPNDVEEPIVSEIDFSEFPIMTVNLAADYSLARLKEEGDDLADALEAIPSVLEVDVVGGLEREVQVNVDLNALQAYNITFNDIVETVAGENVNIPGGSVDVDRLNYLVRVDGEFDDPAEINDLVISAPDGTPIYVRDVADVIFGYKDRASYARLRVLKDEDADGTWERLSDADVQTLQVVSLNIKKRSGDNILETTASVRQVLDEYQLPAGTQAVITGDVSKNVNTLVDDLENNIIGGLIFVVAVLLFFLGVRNATLVGIAIPLSMFISFVVLQIMGYTLNFIILFSLIIALGMLVDNAVVIVENIYRFREMGHSRFEAARLGTAEVGGAVVASTATTVAAFAPMLFWPGIIGEFMSYMPLTLIITLASSLFVAIIINPVITGIFVQLEGEKKEKYTKFGRRIIAGLIIFLGLALGFANWRTLVVLVALIPALILLHRFVLAPIGDRFVKTGLPRFTNRYRTFLTWVLKRDYSVKHAFLRNTFSLTAFTFGLIGTFLGFMLAGVGTPVVDIPFDENMIVPFGVTGLLVYVPGMFLLLAGVAGIVIHVLESIYLGGKGSVRGGLIFGLVSLTLLGLLYISGTPLDMVTIAELLVFPIIIVVVGLIGAIFNKRTVLILTDNRAKILTGALGAFVGIMVLFQLAPTGVIFFPPTDPTQVRVTIESQLGTNIEASNRVAETALARINTLLNENAASKENVKNTLVNVGVSADADFGGGASSPERTRLTMNMIDFGDRAEPSTQTLERLRNQLRGIPGTEIEVSQDNNGPPVGAPVNIEVTGSDFAVITRITRQVKELLTDASESGAIPGLVDVQDNLNTGRPELRVNIDRERAARFGLTSQEVASTVRSAINGIETGKYRDGEDEYDIYVRLAEAERSTLESLENLTILHEGEQIPIVAVASFEVSGGLGSVTRLDLKRVATITGKAAPGFNGPEVLAEVQQYMAAADFEQNNVPAGYQLAYTGESEDQAESFGFLFTALLVGVALIFMIMVAQFNSLSSPFIIMVAVGFSLIGVLLGLILTRTPFGLMTFIGVISLAGIVVNNNIVLIDYIMQLRDRGMSKLDAIIEGGATRLRPVLLTAMTTVLGLIPLTFGINIDFVSLLANMDPNFQLGSDNTQFWGPMGISIISGLTFATFLTLVIVPAMYSVFDSISGRLQIVFKGKAAAPESEASLEVPGDGSTLNAPIFPPQPSGMPA